ncbi:Uncharacterised protein [Vibrio cholerae]|uniref:Uncharacterized protein n=1 Tax=Vibrio cholerae TaxID=666 RepID=A0A656AYY4_VIBCL|nr:Uncharacterised protein [Vibrio cholerae]CSD53746.1 Uncharacterised protein [Vibrio cholerae]
MRRLLYFDFNHFIAIYFHVFTRKKLMKILTQGLIFWLTFEHKVYTVIKSPVDMIIVPF